jgi:exodeoxyribonuclease V alpha subunit
VGAEGQRLDASAHYVVKVPGCLLSMLVERGQLWQVSRAPQSNTIIVNGYRLTESTITPRTLTLLRPSGEHIVTLLAESDTIKGMGQIKARRLWDRFGQDLYSVFPIPGKPSTHLPRTPLALPRTTPSPGSRRGRSSTRGF